MPEAELVHATTIAIGGRGVLISGPPGSGKSDLALRLIDRGAVLVSDDQTLVRGEGGRALATAPATIAGKLEVRGLGIVAMARVDSAPLALCVALGGAIVRLPEPRSRTLAGVTLPELALDPHPVSAPIKVELALAYPEVVTS